MSRILQILSLVVVTFSCSHELRVGVDFDREIEVHRLPNYRWLLAKDTESRNNPIYFNELTDKRIRRAVDEQLRLKGYTPSDTLAQLIVHYHIIIENSTSVRTEPLGYRYGEYWRESNVDSFRYREGTLILDFMDSRNSELIWRGWAVSILDDEKLIDEDLVNKGVVEIFKKFPSSFVKEMAE